MATVPIEIVLQDAETPVDPTSTPEFGEETNIVVPSTGTISNDRDSNGGIGSAISIILPIVIAVLALGTMVALLVRRQQKRKKVNDGTEECSAKVSKKIISKKEKLATATTATLAVLAATVLVGNICMTATNAATDNTTNGTTLTTLDKIQIIANRYEDVTIVASTKAISYATTDTTFGYKIFMSMAGENANLYLDGDTGSDYYFVPTENAGLDDNSWGYSLNSKANYSAMPLANDPLMAQQNIEAVENEEFTVYYTMKADKDMPFGIYSGEIAYDIEGYNGFPDTLTTMQGMTSEICDAVATPNAFKADGVTIEDNVPTTTLTDIRDNKTYTVAKLADGKCWMTQNLDLQKEDLVAPLDNTNTDNPANGFELLDSQTSGGESWGNSELAINTAHVYDLNGDGREYHYCIRKADWGGCDAYSDVAIPAVDLGNYYNWYSATAGTGTYSLGSGETASGSICPAEWRLPDSSSDGGATDYSALLYI